MGKFTWIVKRRSSVKFNNKKNFPFRLYQLSNTKYLYTTKGRNRLSPSFWYRTKNPKLDKID